MSSIFARMATQDITSTTESSSPNDIVAFEKGDCRRLWNILLNSQDCPSAISFTLWKLFCNRVKNHDATFSPDSLGAFSLSADGLQTLLKLGDTLRDRFSIGKTRDSDALL
jgi:hypothetical protein